MMQSTMLLLLATLLGPLAGPTRAAASQDPGPTVTVVRSAGMPVSVESARVVSEDGACVVELTVNNSGDDEIIRLETTIVVYDPIAGRRQPQVDQASGEDLPIPGHAERRLRVAVEGYVAEDARVGVGISGLATAIAQWTNARVGRDFDRTIGPPELVVLNPEGLPAELTDVRLQHSSDGLPTGLDLVVHNRSSSSISGISVYVFVFNYDVARGSATHRYESAWEVAERVIQPGASTSRSLSFRGRLVPRPKEVPDWRVVVTVARTERRFLTIEVLEKARMALLQARQQ